MTDLRELPRLPPNILMPTQYALEQAGMVGMMEASKTWSKSQCRTCGGRGTFRTWIGGKPGPDAEVGTFRCPCREQLRLRRWFTVHGLQPGYFDFSILHTLGWGPEDPRFLWMDDTIKNKINRGRYPSSSFITATGRTTGRSLAAVLVLKAMLLRGMNAYILGSSQMGSVMNNWYGDQGEIVRDWWTTRVRSAQVLIIEDLGREQTTNDTSISKVRDLLAHRSLYDLPTIITTRASTDKIISHYGGEEMEGFLSNSRHVQFSHPGEPFDRDALGLAYDTLDVDKPALFLSPLTTTKPEN